MFVLLPTYRVPLAQIDAMMEEHRVWVDEHRDSGRFLLYGRRVPREGAFILVADGDRGEIERIAASDPFATAGLATYEVLEVHPAGGAPEVLRTLAAHGVNAAQQPAR
ncbi:YciI family protein [Pseudonocardia sp. GCM10023141]|uniref:YciI family protein n=1 Tax=Pseudonocardia sp. GCM10023141 TaxID=3252653 RepID=UPI003610CAA0